MFEFSNLTHLELQPDVYSKFIRGFDSADRDISYLSGHIVSLWEAVFSLSMDLTFIGKIFLLTRNIHLEGVSGVSQDRCERTERNGHLCSRMPHASISGKPTVMPYSFRWH